MKKIAFSLLFAILSAGACAGIGAFEGPSAVSLPQPCTILICVAGMGLVFFSARRT